jgi:hypothetical protein
MTTSVVGVWGVMSGTPPLPFVLSRGRLINLVAMGPLLRSALIHCSSWEPQAEFTRHCIASLRSLAHSSLLSWWAVGALRVLLVVAVASKTQAADCPPGTDRYRQVASFPRASTVDVRAFRCKHANWKCHYNNTAQQWNCKWETYAPTTSPTPTPLAPGAPPRHAHRHEAARFEKATWRRRNRCAIFFSEL